MAGDLTLYIGNKNYSSWSMRPWVLMRQAGIDFDEVMIRFDSFAPDSAFKRRLFAVTPTGKVPALQAVIDGRPQVIWDTLAIAEYLAERFPGSHLWPAQAASRARARSVTAEMHSGFAALRSHFGFNVEANLPQVGQRVLAEQAAVRADVARITQMWNDCLDASGGPFLFGGFCIADAFFAPIVLRFRTYGVPLDATCVGYARRVTQTAAVAQWIVEALAEKDFLPFEEPYRSAPRPNEA
ncbi:MAG TPA: glutathione S-transferase family protein [Zeimonas sp.]|nr:glutathione S-transferase family protein [Zeimonas sp.]